MWNLIFHIGLIWLLVDLLLAWGWYKLRASGREIIRERD